MRTERFEHLELFSDETRQKLWSARQRRQLRIQALTERAERRLVPTIQTLVTHQDDRIAVQVRRVAAGLAADGVEGFAGCLLDTGRIGTHAVRLRDFTAALIDEVRQGLRQSKVFEATEPTWEEDPVARRAIAKCERILRDRQTLGDCCDFGGPIPKRGRATWPGIVQAWEAHKSTCQSEMHEQERIPESFIRQWLSAPSRGKPEEG